MNSLPIKLCATLSLFALSVASPGRVPGQGCDTCNTCASPCAPVCESSCPPSCESPCSPQTCTILVPQMVTEYQTCWRTRYRSEARQRMVTVYRDVPTTSTVEEEYTVMVPQTRTRTVAETINHPVYGDIQLRTTSMTPEVDVRQSTQTVTEMVAFQEQRTVNCGCSPAPPPSAAPDETPANPPPARSDSTSSAETQVGGGCSTCGDPCPSCRVCVTCWKPVSHQVTVRYPVSRFTPNSRDDTVSFYEYQPETKLHNEAYVVQVPEKRVRTRHFTVMRTVAEERPEQYTVTVPYQESFQVPVVTCRWVEKTVVVR